MGGLGGGRRVAVREGAGWWVGAKTSCNGAYGAGKRCGGGTSALGVTPPALQGAPLGGPDF